MTKQKEQAIVGLIKAATSLDLSSVLILKVGANMLKAKEKLDRNASSCRAADSEGERDFLNKEERP